MLGLELFYFLLRELSDHRSIPMYYLKTILLLIGHPELSWKIICRGQCVKHVMEYLLIRACNHPDKVHGFVDRLLKQYVPEIPSQMVRIYRQTEQQKAVGAWLCDYAERRLPFDEIKHRHTLNEVGDVGEGKYDWKIDRGRGEQLR